MGYTLCMSPPPLKIKLNISLADPLAGRTKRGDRIAENPGRCDLVPFPQSLHGTVSALWGKTCEISVQARSLPSKTH